MTPSPKRKDIIIIIGPMGVGKSTVAEALSQRLDWPQYPLDSMKKYFYFKAGYDNRKARQIENSAGFMALIEYSQPFYVAAVRGALSSFDQCIIDLGGNHTYVDQSGKEELQEILAAYEYVILLLPTRDMTENVAILNGRLRKRWRRKSETSILATLEANVNYLKDPLIYQVANYVFFTSNILIDDLVTEIIDTCGLTPAVNPT